jgi:hypothetical protein
MNTSSSDEFPVLMERLLKLRSSQDGCLSDVVVQIGYPVWTEHNVEAACPVAFRGGIGRVNDIRGIDPISAMKQAITFVETYLTRSEAGDKFFWPDGEEY